MKIIAAIQARYDSTRLPGKIVADLNGLPCITHIWRRLMACRNIDGICVSWGCPHEERKGSKCQICTDTLIEKSRWPLRVVCGPEIDLVARHLQTAAVMQADAIVRVTGDCPLIDPTMLDDMVALYRQSWPKIDVLTNTWPKATLPDGLDLDIIGTHILAKLAADPASPREEFIGYMYHGTNLNLRCWDIHQDLSDWRITLDYEADRLAISTILSTIGNDTWNWHEIPEALVLKQARPDYLAGRIATP